VSNFVAHLHATAQAQHQVQRRLLLDVVVGERAAVLQLLTGKDEALLIRRNACAASPSPIKRKSKSPRSRTGSMVMNVKCASTHTCTFYTTGC